MTDGTQRLPLGVDDPVIMPPGVRCQGSGRIWRATLRAMRFVRRAIAAIAAMAITATIFRIRGSGGTPPQHGGWRPLELPER